jgi:hypothetical protein
MPEPIYEYHLLYYSATGKLEPPLGGDWRIYKSRVSRTAIGATVLWRRPIESPKVESSEVQEFCTLQVNCISGDLLCRGPYGPDKDHEENIYKCGPCSEYERKYSRGKATFREMLEGCEELIRTRVEPNVVDDLDLIRETRLHVNLHGYPAMQEDRKARVESLFHSLYTKKYR